MVVQHNLTAMNANRYLGINNSKLSKSLEKLSSGYAINRAGDNAAGLAVSEKMRSQIAGMTQAVKNAQDGISMVQTFEGALTETDSILQRMKTLANQMANGSYDDPVDRTAAQQEFLQLNDELDQIADTDFNGVVVLNGGVMADGTMAEGVSLKDAKDADGNTMLDGYGKTIKEKVYDKDAAGAGAIDYKKYAEKVAAEEAAAKANAPTDMVAKKDYVTKAPDLDDKGYNQKAADALFKDAVENGGLAKDASSVNITYKITKLDDDGNVTEVKAYYDNGTEVGTDGIASVTPTDNGGWSIKSGDAAAKEGDLGNVILDTIGAKVGDFVTVEYSKPAGTPQAPTNAGFKDSNVEGTGVKITGATGGLNLDLAKTAGVEIHDDVADKWTDETDGATYREAIKQLDGAKLSISYTTNANGDDLATNGVVVKFTPVADGATELTLAAGATTGWGISAAPVKDNTAIQLTYNGKNIATLTPADLSTALDGSADVKNKTVVMGYDIVVDGYREPGTVGLNAKLTQGKEAAAAGEDYSVSKSDAFKNSEAQLTYKDNITLQVGARTKDAVNFTFKYASTAIGELKDDLDCTANGLGTDRLNLSTQEAANYAIDKIDQAINKVSLVRGTFGAIQNRLEHKIDNLNVSVENLTSAESQIRDTNMPQEMMNFTKQQILAQASQSMLAQANQLPQGVLSLLQ